MTDSRDNGNHDGVVHNDANREDIDTGEQQPRKKSNKRLPGLVAALGLLSAAYVVQRSMPPQPDAPFQNYWKPTIVKTKDGRQLLWAKGPRELESGEWFDMTDSPLDPREFEHGIGKDKILAIDNPEFVSISDSAKLEDREITDNTMVIGYINNGEAKAYPVKIMNQHELVNDMIGGEPLTVGW